MATRVGAGLHSQTPNRSTGGDEACLPQSPQNPAPYRFWPVLVKPPEISQVPNAPAGHCAITGLVHDPQGFGLMGERTFTVNE